MKSPLNPFAVLNLIVTRKGEWVWSYDHTAVMQALCDAIVRVHPDYIGPDEERTLDDVLDAGEALLFDADRATRTIRAREEYLFESMDKLDRFRILDNPIGWIVEQAQRASMAFLAIFKLPYYIASETLDHESFGLSEAIEEAIDILRSTPHDEEADWTSALSNFVADNRVMFRFRSASWLSQGYEVLGKASTNIPKEIRSTLTGPPADRPISLITLNLRYWIVASAPERARLVLHELCHLDPSIPPGAMSGRDWKVKLRHHTIEEHRIVLARYGALDKGQLGAVIAGAAHPAAAACAKAWSPIVDERGQSLLFETDYKPALARVRGSIDELRTLPGVASVTLSALGGSVTLTGGRQPGKSL